MSEPWRTTAWTSWWVMLLVQLYGLYGPVVEGPGGPLSLDKLGHVLMFGVAAAVAAALRSRAALTVVVLHALVSEPLQAVLTSTRQADVLDLAADLVGIVLGVGVVGWWQVRAEDRSQEPVR
ncbi:VanZ family protein [Ornithinicoccus halotolerans]|uniref:VanZ family protein n=1 Tax=Ornithinicoccus halotolerans TaxID=1748220 RepID=UPI001294D96F|nr:VanZ family protein [Ornithinicoccus halotolerans]